MFAVLSMLAGCRRNGTGPIDPGRPDQLAPCGEGLHLVMGLQAPSTDKEQALLRFTQDLAQCQGAIVRYDDYGTLSTVGGLPDGTDMVGFRGDFGYGGVLARFDGQTSIGRIEDPMFYPIGIAPLTFHGQPAIAVAWGSGSSSSDSGERLDIYAQADLAPLGSWDTSYELVRVAAPPSGQADRVAAMIGGGLQEYRADPGGATLATTGELQVAKPSTVGWARSLDVSGVDVRAATQRGVMSWRTGQAPAFLGPVQCRWPDTTTTPLPSDDAAYVSAVIDRSSPDDTLVVVDGEVAGSDADTFLYVLRPRGECGLIAEIPSGYRAVSIAWSGR